MQAVQHGCKRPYRLFFVRSEVELPLPDNPPWHMLLHTKKEHLDSIHTELFGLLGSGAPAWLPPVHTRLAENKAAGKCPTAGADLWAHTLRLDGDETQRQTQLKELRALQGGGGGGAGGRGPMVGPARGSSSFVPTQYVPRTRAPTAAPAPAPAPAQVPAFDASALAEAKSRAAAAAQRIAVGLAGASAVPPAAKRPRT